MLRSLLNSHGNSGGSINDDRSSPSHRFPTSPLPYVSMALTLFVKEEGWVDLSDTNSGSRVFLFAAIFLIYLLLFGLNMHFAGPPGFSSTGFDIDAKDKAYKNECKIAVSSCIFGSSDFLRRPTSKKDCERRALVKLFRHREEPSPPGPPPVT
ncbi:hypothetical protein GBA52_002919 [Prunus armeniaca]|nr:hypothetical protein GBA52_002919 [Prunus armeniaca]